ncbi:hypothetical protein PR048_005181 [Dryococelus australis]|uniref:Uncharacterized protein n=1 Tax=Dryococelus australis TaxID=614101 RepID=A0ABQ9I8L4_9NEOP|nr:hypothetical protein PR048_005181 [Dryococelus australis]
MPVGRFLGLMLSAIARDNLVDSSCIVIVTHRRTGRILKYIKEVRPVYNILEPIGDLETSEDLAFNEQLGQRIWLSNFSFQGMVLHTMNEGCSSYIFQTAKPKAMLRMVADLFRRSITRMSRKFIFIPPTHIFTGWPHTHNEYSNENEIFSMKEASFIPGIVIIRPALVKYTELYSSKCSEKQYQESYFIRAKGQLQASHLQDTILLFPGEECVSNIKNNTLLSAMKNEAVKDHRLNLGMKVNNDVHGDEFTSTCKPRCPQTQAGLVIEAITHMFSYPDPSGTRVLTRWSVTSGVQHVGNLFPDKLVDLGGRPLTVTTLDYLPYTIMDFMNQKDVDDGTEFFLVRQLARRLNFTWKKELDSEHLWGEIQEDGTGEYPAAFYISNAYI